MPQVVSRRLQLTSAAPNSVSLLSLPTQGQVSLRVALGELSLQRRCCICCIISTVKLHSTTQALVGDLTAPVDCSNCFPRIIFSCISSDFIWLTLNVDVDIQRTHTHADYGSHIIRKRTTTAYPEPGSEWFWPKLHNPLTMWCFTFFLYCFCTIYCILYFGASLCISIRSFHFGFRVYCNMTRASCLIEGSVISHYFHEQTQRTRH